MHGNGIRDGVLLGLVLFTLVQAAMRWRASKPWLRIPRRIPTRINFAGRRRLLRRRWIMAQLFSVPAATDNQAFSPTEFRPRKHSVLDNDFVNPVGDAPMLRGTTVWQRMSEYKSHDRLRLLTLWESSGSTVSLQAGKHGDPSLQWTSRLMNRGGATHGLLDRLFSASLAHAGSSLRNAARPASTGRSKNPAFQRASTGCIHLADRKVNVSVGHLLVLDCGVLHDVEALEESALLLTISWRREKSDTSESFSSSQQHIDEEAVSRMDDEGGAPEAAVHQPGVARKASLGS